MSPEAGAHQVKRGLTWRWRDVSKAAKAAVEFAGERARRVVGAQVGGRHRWLGMALQLGNLHEVSRKVAAWSRAPDAAL